MQFGDLTVEQWMQLVLEGQQQQTQVIKEFPVNNSISSLESSHNTYPHNDANSIPNTQITTQTTSEKLPSKPISWAAIASKHSATTHTLSKLSNGTSLPPATTTDHSSLEQSSDFKDSSSTQHDKHSMLTLNPNLNVVEIHQPYYPRGLTNPGNLCFVNVVLQALFACTWFRSTVLFFGSMEIPDTCRLLQKMVKLAYDIIKSPSPRPVTPALTGNTSKVGSVSTSSAGNVSTMESQRLMNDIAWLNRESLRPDYLYEVPSCAASGSEMAYTLAELMNRGSQEDAQEFLIHLLDSMHEEILEWNRIFGSKESIHLADLMINSTDTDVGEQWEEVGRKGRAVVVRNPDAESVRTYVTALFGGMLRSELRRAHAKPSVTKEPFMCLQLEIDRPIVKVLDDALRLFFEPESLEGYKSESTKEAVDAKKHFFIDRLPPILILQLKRFSYDSETQTLAKISKRISYPEELYIQPSFFSSASLVPKKEDRMYQLSAVVTHHGQELAGGHYTCDVRRKQEQQQRQQKQESMKMRDLKSTWVLCDDSKLIRENSENVLHRQAYLLFYSRHTIPT